MLLTNKFNKLVLFILSSLAMVFMHVLSTLLGAVLPIILPKVVVSILVIALFAYFSFSLLKSSVLLKSCSKKGDKDDSTSDSSSDSEYEEAKE